MQKILQNDIIPQFLINPEYRLYRHILLLIAILILSASTVYNMPKEYIVGGTRLYAWIAYIVIFAASIYLNIYILAPRLLLKNKLFKYFISLLLIVGASITGAYIIQKNLFIIEPRMEKIGPVAVYLSVLSSSISFILIYIGTTTLLLFKHWIISTKRIDELQAETLQSELKLLKNQINPHFLFNMLNNANVLIRKNGEEASQVLFKLEDLLRYQLNDSAKEKVSLSSDIHFLNDFLNLEKIRRDNFEFIISKEGNINNIYIPPLLFIPFVENAVKHNPDSENRSYVNLFFKVYQNQLEFTCINSKPEKSNNLSITGGLGLKNIKRRLELLFPEKYVLIIENKDNQYIVKLSLQL